MSEKKFWNWMHNNGKHFISLFLVYFSIEIHTARISEFSRLTVDGPYRLHYNLFSRSSIKAILHIQGVREDQKSDYTVCTKIQTATKPLDIN